MCGICGTVGISEKKYIDIMNPAQKHRGPDGAGVFFNGPCCLGHTRLSIIDLSKLGNQPMKNEDGNVVITFNGEIYNFEKLRLELIAKGHTFSSKTDTEVIVHLYEEYGEDCLKKLRGIFAFAIWDKKKQKLFCARDRLGVKPFYYYENGGQLIFASELRTILKTGLVQKVINDNALSGYLLFGSVQAPETLVKGIMELMPGCCMTWQEKTKTRKYWDLQKVMKQQDHLTEVDITNKLKEAVKVESISDVKVGIFLSGGLDSSILTYLASKNQKNTQTLTLGFDEIGYDESQQAKEVADFCSANNKIAKIKPKAVLSKLTKILKCFDQPSADGFNTFLIAEFAKSQGFKVAMSGLGGDELFSGYPNVNAIKPLIRINRIVRRLPSQFRNFIFRLFYKDKLPIRIKKLLYLFCKVEDDLAAYQLSRMELMPVDVEKMTNNAVKTRKIKCHGLDIADFLTQSDIECYMQNTLLRNSDIMGMANSIEIRVPCLDYLFVEKVLSSSSQVRLRGGRKGILRRISPEISSIVGSQKRSFFLPFDEWLSNELRGFCDNLLSKNLTASPLNKKPIFELWKNFLTHRRSYSPRAILSIISFLYWFDENMVD